MKLQVVKYIKQCTAIGALFAAVAFSLMSCENPPGEHYGNTLPDTRLANIPVNDTIAQYIQQGVIPQKTLYWVGDDPDGFVIAFKYRWIDFRVSGYDSTEWSTVLNLTSLSGIPFDTLISVSNHATSIYRIYNFLATLDPSENRALIERILDSVGTARMFAVPYPNGPIAGDSIRGADPIEIESPTKANFIFFSPADSNQHRFEVRSVDNSDEEDPTPAFVHFWTLRSQGPTVFFAVGPTGVPLNPDSTTTTYVLRCPTELAPGLTFVFAGSDASTDQREYSWSIDDTLHWSEWTNNATALVTGAHFQETGSDTHRIYVRGRNRWGVLSQIVGRRFLASIPNIDREGWAQRTLFINSTRGVGGGNPGVGGVDTNSINTFYREVFDSIGLHNVDVWTVQGRPPGTNHPSAAVLLNYSSVVFSAEVSVYGLFGVAYRFNLDDQASMIQYLNLGGKLIYSGTPRIDNVVAAYNATPIRAGWADSMLHVAPSYIVPFQVNTQRDFIGVRGAEGYPDVEIDSTKVGADSGYAIGNIALVYPYDFGKTISYFVSKSGDIFFDNRPVGIRYLGPPHPTQGCRPLYSVVHMGFPLYFVKKPQVIQTLRRAFEDINELP